MNSAVKTIENVEKGVLVTYSNQRDGKKEVLESDIVLIATGRKPYTTGLGLEDLSIATSEMGKILVDSNWQTNISNILSFNTQPNFTR